MPFILMASLFALSACHHDPETPTVPVARTVLVYMMADNTLSSFSSSDISEMLEGMGNVDVTENNLLIYVDTYGGTPQLIKITKENGKAVQTVIKTYDEQISTSETVMKSVLSNVFSAYPAESYGLVLWSHGWGWVQQTSTASSKVISRWAGVDNNGDRYNIHYYLNMSNLKSVLAATNIHFDYILFDECFMASVEALYDIKEYADYFIGSATEIPGPGAYYADIVTAMFASSYSKATTNNAEKVAKAYFTYYNNKYDPTKQTDSSVFSNSNWIAGASVALVKSSELSNLAAATKPIIAKYVQKKQELDTNGIFCYDPLREKYFYDIENLVKKLTGGNTEYTSWKTVFDNCVASYQTTATNYMSYNDGSYQFISMTGSYGLSTYIPSSTRTTQNTNFQSTAWYTDAGWNQTGW